MTTPQQERAISTTNEPFPSIHDTLSLTDMVLQFLV